MRPPKISEIEAEIEKLEKMKPTVLRRSAFGDDHHAAIDAQIMVLTEMMTEDQIYDAFPRASESGDGYPDNICESALDAAMWLLGESEHGAPSEEWKSLVREKPLREANGGVEIASREKTTKGGKS